MLMTVRMVVVMVIIMMAMAMAMMMMVATTRNATGCQYAICVPSPVVGTS